MEDIIDLYIGIENVKTVIEAGACDCADSVTMTVVYPNAHIYAFECNPETIPLCRQKVSDRITLTEAALGNQTGDVTFYPIDTKLTKTIHENGNPGASSFFKANPEYPLETYVQGQITVPMITLKDFCTVKGIESIDLLWLDAQGSELNILKGMGEHLKKVKVIKTEVLLKEQYLGAPDFEVVEEWLDANGFRFVRFLGRHNDKTWFDDAIFVNKDL